MSPKTWMVPVVFKSLRELYLSCIEHEPGISVLPFLPDLETLDLNFCCYCQDCPRNGQRPCTMLQLNRLPKLRGLSISGAQEGNIIYEGQSTGLRVLKIMFSDGLSLNEILAAAGPNLEEIRIRDCEFAQKDPVDQIAYPMLRQLSLADSLGGLAAFQLAGLPSSALLSVRAHVHDFEQFDGWPQLIHLLKGITVDLWLSGPVEARRHDTNSRLSQMLMMPQIRLKGSN
ncbi:uncharacterized protein BDV14DRAFT_203814 [Aspergillus stella-maris]|uniref:uncharacterized protein n=1 Tax=Aspergillus stella-maris TaxID=1810926 RepID=UPI003CCDF124